MILEQLCKYPIENEKDLQLKIKLANDKLLAKGEIRKYRHDQKVKAIKYEVGQLVLVKNHELSSAIDKEIKNVFLLHEGPFKIVQVKMENAYVLVDPETREIKGIYNTTQLKKFYPEE